MPKTIDLVELSPAAIQALAAGDLAAANRVALFPLTSYYVGQDCLGVWCFRSLRIVDDPPSAGWITRIIVDTDKQIAVGRAGHHRPPDADGMVEVGYSVDSEYRRQGYARLRASLLCNTDSSKWASNGTTKTDLRRSSRSVRAGDENGWRRDGDVDPASQCQS